VRHSLRKITQCLNRHQVRASYRVVCEVSGLSPAELAVAIGEPRHETSWIVDIRTGVPVGFAPEELHPALLTAPVITLADELRALLRKPYRSRASGDR
jgi:hypothetical protein